MERKLSTILASDVVGFSKMMAANEEYTLRDRSRRRQGQRAAAAASRIAAAAADYHASAMASARAFCRPTQR